MNKEKSPNKKTLDNVRKVKKREKDVDDEIIRIHILENDDAS
tara:strand:- start:351 stop:476 length:126 start_codon:yes stop_codon:yes gene_type:complete